MTNGRPLVLSIPGWSPGNAFTAMEISVACRRGVVAFPRPGRIAKHPYSGDGLTRESGRGDKGRLPALPLAGDTSQRYMFRPQI